jgi:hypothetical protein
VWPLSRPAARADDGHATDAADDAHAVAHREAGGRAGEDSMFGTLLRRMRETVDGSTAREATTPTAIEYVSEEVTRLNRIRRDHTEARSRLAKEEARWERLRERTDPEAHQLRDDLGPRILELRTRVAALAAEETATEQAVVQTTQLVAEYAALAGDTTAQFQPLFDAVARVTPDVVSNMYARSRELDHRALELLGRTGDRQFRRPLCDPYSQLRDGLTEALRVVERQRLMRRSMPSANESKTAS